MYQCQMKLTPEQEAILRGDEGEVKAKAMETLVRFGDIFGARGLVPITHKSGHLVTSFGIGLLKSLFRTMDSLIGAGLKAEGDFTVDPRPVDFENVRCNPLEKLVFSKFLYSNQKGYEEQLARLGLRDSNSFTCACYLVGNVPRKGDILSWAESSAVVFANSVLGARCNRNSAMIELFGSILGLVPCFGLLTDEGRKASWKVVLKTTRLPEAQVLGSAIGMKVTEDVPYVYGLDRYLGRDINDPAAVSYLKDFGAATASNGAVGLYHIDGLTPEAVEMGEALIKDGAREYVIDDAELERVYKSYPVMWKDPEAKPKICFIGCPHLTLDQVRTWTDRLQEGLKASGRSRVSCQTVLTAPPDIADAFRRTPDYQRLLATGARLSSICPLMYTSNPLTKLKPIMTNSNKLRTYSMARYYKDEDILAILTGGGK